MVQKQSNYAAWDIEPLQKIPSSQEEMLRHLIGWAILAANSHNVQPWRFILKPLENSIDVCVDEKGILPASDKKARQAFISVGCSVTNILLAAQYYGMEYLLKYQQNQVTYPEPIVSIQFSEPNKTTRDERRLTMDAMKNRRMNRKEYDSQRPVPESMVGKMQRAAEKIDLTCNIITGFTMRFALAELQATADRIVVTRDDFRHELANFLLPNDTTLGRGMPGSTFGLNDETARELHEELKAKGNFNPDKAAGVPAASRAGIRSAPALIVLSVPKDNPAYWIKAGMVFQELAVKAEAEGLGVAVHAALVEDGRMNKILKTSLRRFKERPTVLFRIGYPQDADRPPHSPRLGIEEVIEVVE